MNRLTKYPQKSPHTASRIIEEEAVIVIPQQGIARILNLSGSRVWELSDGNRTLADIIGIICREFEVCESEAGEDALAFIGELESKGMMIITDEPNSR